MSGFAEALAASDVESGAARLWAGDAGEAAATFFAESAAGGGRLSAPLPGRSYPALLRGLMATRWCGRAMAVIRGWPSGDRSRRACSMPISSSSAVSTRAPGRRRPAADPWLSRPMRRDFGLPAPERRIGLAAHDFAQATGRAGGRADARAARRGHADRAVALAAAARWIAAQPSASSRDNPCASRPGSTGRRRSTAPTAVESRWQPPAPCPPLDRAAAHDPSVTEVEAWRRDPYAIYARHILQLEALDPLDAELGAADRGTCDPSAPSRVRARAFRRTLPADALERLLAIGERGIRAAADPAGRSGAFWWPRFERIAAGSWPRTGAARRGLAAVARRGQGPAARFDDPVGPLHADGEGRSHRPRPRWRLGDHRLQDRRACRRRREIDCGFAPQLPLEAAIAAGGRLRRRLPRARSRRWPIWRLSGGDAAAEIKDVKADATESGGCSARRPRNADRRFRAARQPPIIPLPDAEFAPRFSDYAPSGAGQGMVGRRDGEETE